MADKVIAGRLLSENTNIWDKPFVPRADLQEPTEPKQGPPKPKRRDAGRKSLGVSNCSPSAGGGMFLYAVELAEWDGVVKLGRTGSWRKRRKAYADWNHRIGDGIGRAFVLEINDEFVDLAALETALIEGVGLEGFRGREWFYGTCEDVIAKAEHILCRHDISYSLFEE